MLLVFTELKILWDDRDIFLPLPEKNMKLKIGN